MLSGASGLRAVSGCGHVKLSTLNSDNLGLTMEDEMVCDTSSASCGSWLCSLQGSIQNTRTFFEEIACWYAFTLWRRFTVVVRYIVTKSKHVVHVRLMRWLSLTFCVWQTGRKAIEDRDLLSCFSGHFDRFCGQRNVKNVQLLDGNKAVGIAKMIPPQMVSFSVACPYHALDGLCFCSSLIFALQLLHSVLHGAYLQRRLSIKNIRGRNDTVDYIRCCYRRRRLYGDDWDTSTNINPPKR